MLTEEVTATGGSSLLFYPVLLHSTSAPLPSMVTRKIKWGGLSGRHYCQAHFPSYKTLQQQKTEGSNPGLGAGEPLEAIISATIRLGAGKVSDGPKNLLNWLLFKSSALQRLQH